MIVLRPLLRSALNHDSAVFRRFPPMSDMKASPSLLDTAWAFKALPIAPNTRIFLLRPSGFLKITTP